MQVTSPLTIEELQEAKLYAIPKLLRGSVRRRTNSTLKPSKLRLIYTGIVGVVVFLAFAANPSVSPAEKAPFLLLIAAVVIFRLFYAAKSARKGYERQTERMPHVLSVDADGVRFEDKNKAFQFRPWSSYKAWREGPLVFVLRGPQRVVNIVPKRGLTEEQLVQLRSLFASHMLLEQ